MIIDAVELKRLTQQLDGGTEDKIRMMMKEDREARFKLSRARVKEWDNTIAGQRRKKLEARAERIAAEEAERLETDRRYAAEEAERRKNAIDRAKQLQYNSQDSVRAFHSRVLLCQVLKERDLQLQIKKSANSNGLEEDSDYIRDIQKKFEADSEADTKLQLEARKNRMALARDQMKQINEKSRRDADDKKLEKEEAKELARLDREYKEEQRNLEARRRAKCVMLREQLVKMREDLKSRQMESKVQDEADNKRIQAWIVRKSRQSEMKKEVEKEWFGEALQMRERLGEVQARMHNDADARLEEQIRIAMEKKEEQAKKEVHEREMKKKKQQQELKLYFTEYVRQSEIKQATVKAQEKEELMHYQKIREDALREQKQRKAAMLKEGKQLQDFHLKHMERTINERKREKEERLDWDKKMMSGLDQEEQNFLDYMRSVALEKWAKDDHRLQRLVMEAPQEPKRPRPRPAPLNTHNRLGFAPETSYSKDDLLRSNPIVTGNSLV